MELGWAEQGWVELGGRLEGKEASGRYMET